MSSPTSEIRDGVVIIHANLSSVPGDIGMGLVDECLHVNFGSGQRRFIIDLSGANWINSTNIATLIHMQWRINQSLDPSAKLVLCGIGDRIKSILVIAKLTEAFETYDTIEKALEAFTKTAPAPSSESTRS